MNSVKTSQIWQHSISFQMKYLHSESRAEIGTMDEFVENNSYMYRVNELL